MLQYARQRPSKTLYRKPQGKNKNYDAARHLGEHLQNCLKLIAKDCHVIESICTFKSK